MFLLESAFVADVTISAETAPDVGTMPAAADDAAGRLADRRWLGLELLDADEPAGAANDTANDTANDRAGGTAGGGPGFPTLRARVTMAERHLTQLRRMYGGIGLSLVGALAEAATGRTLRWATAQFVASPKLGERIDLVAEVLAAGRRTSQVRVTGTVAGRVVLTALAAAAATNPQIPDGTLPAMPQVPPPEECPLVRLPVPPSTSPGFFGLAEMRRIGDEDSPRLRFWMRVPGLAVTRPVMLPLVADSVPTMVMAALGHHGSGSSLDNTIRVGAAPESEWVLVDGVPEQAAGGYGHGSARLWAPDGSLAGVGSQTAALWYARRQ